MCYLHIINANNLRSRNIDYISNEKCTYFIGIPLCYDFSKISNIFTRILNNNKNEIYNVSLNISSNASLNILSNASLNASSNASSNISSNGSFNASSNEPFDDLFNNTSNTTIDVTIDVLSNPNNNNKEWIDEMIKKSICPEKNKYTLIPFNIELLIENINSNIKNALFRYYITADYSCPINNRTDTNNVTLMLPISVENIKQKSQFILIERLYQHIIDNSTIKIYNPYNYLKMKPIFKSFISDNVLYILPWNEVISNFMIKIEHTSYYTNIIIPKIEINRIIIDFDNFYRILDNNISTYMSIKS
jgi:hypothetical protein